MPLPPLHVRGDSGIEEDPDLGQPAADDTERPVGDRLGPVVGRVLEPVALEPLDLAEAVESEGADFAVHMAKPGAGDALVGDPEAVLAQEGGHDIAHVLDAALVEVAGLVHVEHLPVQVLGEEVVLALERRLELGEHLVEVLPKPGLPILQTGP
jgi:hypothetical protein